MQKTIRLLPVLALFLLAGCSLNSQERLELKEEIKQEILAELHLYESRQPQKQPTATVKDHERMKMEIEQEILAKIKRHENFSVGPIENRHLQLVDQTAQKAGSVTGQMLHDGQGLPDCQVKLVHLIPTSGFIGLWGTYQESQEFITITDQKGKFRFEEIPVGDYKIKWQLPQRKGWIRRLRDKPDVTIEEDKVQTLKPIETNKKVISH